MDQAELDEIKQRDHGPTAWEKRIIGVLMVFVLIFAANVALNQLRFGSINGRFDDGETRTYQTRAVLCQTLLALGQTDQSGVCNLKEVLAYYNPDDVPLTPTAGIVCDVIQQSIEANPDSGVHLPEGCVRHVDD